MGLVSVAGTVSTDLILRRAKLNCFAESWENSSYFNVNEPEYFYCFC